MKTTFYKQKLIFAISAILILATSAVIYTENSFSISLKNYLEKNEIAATIINSALIVIAVNLLIFAIGLLSRSSVKNHSIIRKVYKRSRAKRRRSIEGRQFDVLSQIR